VQKFKICDFCKIIDVAERDGFFKNRDIVIGKIVRYMGPFHVVGEQEEGFRSCLVQCWDEFTIGSDHYKKGFVFPFASVKLEKVQKPSSEDKKEEKSTSSHDLGPERFEGNTSGPHGTHRTGPRGTYYRDPNDLGNEYERW